MGIVLVVLVGKIFITENEMGIRLLVDQDVVNSQVDLWCDLFDVLIIQFHLVTVSLDGCSVFLEANGL